MKTIKKIFLLFIIMTMLVSCKKENTNKSKDNVSDGKNKIEDKIIKEPIKETTNSVEFKTE